MTNLIVYDLEFFNTNRTVLYANWIYRVRKCSSKYNRDETQREYEKCRKDCVVFKGTDSVNEMLDYVKQIKAKAKKINNKTVKYDLYRLAHNGSRFDNYVVSN